MGMASDLALLGRILSESPRFVGPRRTPARFVPPMDQYSVCFRMVLSHSLNADSLIA